jgi:hypothetical protein
MAESNAYTLNIDAMNGLADRLYSSGVSRLFDDSPSMQADMRSASRVIRSVLSKIDRVAAFAGDVERSLRNLRVSVEG